MVETSDFSVEKIKMTLDSFEDGSIAQDYPVSEASASGMAAYTSTQSGVATSEDLVDEFELERQSILGGQGPVGHSLNMLRQRDEIIEQNNELIESILRDESMSIEEKRENISIVPEIETTELPPAIDLAAEQGLQEDSEPHDGPAQQRSRIDGAQMIGEVNAHKRELQSMINGQVMLEDQDLTGTVWEVLELMVPFTEWKNAEGLAQEMFDTEGDWEVKSLRAWRNKMIEATQQMGLEEQKVFAQKLFSIMQNHEQVFMSDSNDLNKAMNLNWILGTENYSDFDAVLDEFTSWADVIGLGSLVAGIARTGKRVKIAEQVRMAADVNQELSFPNMARIDADQRLAADVDQELSFPNMARIDEEQAAIAASKEITPGAISPSQLEAQRREGITFTPSELKAEAERIASSGGTPSEMAQAAREAVNPRTRAEADAVHTRIESEVQPTAIGEVYKDTNPRMARTANEAAEASPQAAEAMYGTNKAEVVQHNRGTAKQLEGGTVPNRVDMNGGAKTPDARPGEIHFDPDVKAIVHADPIGRFTANELARAKNGITNTFQNITGMKLADNGFSVGTNANGTMRVTALYGMEDGAGSSNAIQAVDNALFHLRNTGVSADDLTVYERTARGWEPVDLKKARAETIVKDAGGPIGPKEYRVGVDHNYRANLEEIGQLDADIAAGNIASAWVNNFTKNFGGATEGSVAQHLFDPASVIHPKAFGSHVAQNDSAVALREALTNGQDMWLKDWRKLPKQDRAAVTDRINHDMFNEVAFNESALKADGFTADQIKSLRDWRRLQDTNWQIANFDMNQQLRGQGFGMFYHEASDTRLIGKRVERTATKLRQDPKVYDVNEGATRTMSEADVDELYESGGYIGRSKSGFSPNQGDDLVEFFVVRDTQTGGYIRRINVENDVTLARREGYYPTQYDMTDVIYKKVKTADGRVREVVVGGGQNKFDTQKMADMLNASPTVLRAGEEPTEYLVRSARERGTALDDAFDMYASNGFSNQRVRGDRLINAGSSVHKIDKGILVDPMQATARNMSQMAKRTEVGKTLQTMRQRFIDNYKDVVDLPTRWGEPILPTHHSQIKPRGGRANTDYGRALDDFNYIRSQEDGFLNTIDELSKGIMYTMADATSGQSNKFARKLSGAAESVAKSPMGGPNAVVRKAAFDAYIRLNPMRYWPMNMSQYLQVAAIRPGYFTATTKKGKVVAGQAFKDNARLEMHLLGVNKSTDPKIVAAAEGYLRSGLTQADNTHAMARHASLDTARRSEQTNAAARAVGHLWDAPKKAGFDFSENMLMRWSFMTFFDEAWEAGLRGDVAVKQAVARARNITLNMNKGGDIPQQSNSASMVMQFTQVPFKTFNTMMPFVGNRGLSNGEKAKLAFANTMFWGLPFWGSWVSNEVLQGVPEGELREALRWGFLSTALDKVANIFGEDLELDLAADFMPTSLNAESIPGLMMVSALTSTDLASTFADAPGGSLIFGGDSKIAQALKTTARYFDSGWLIRPLGGEEREDSLDIEWKDVARAWFNLSGGYSNAMKSQMLNRTRVLMSQTGKITDADVSYLESIASSAFGAKTRTEMLGFKRGELLYGDKSFETDDVKTWYNDLKRALARRGISNQEAQFQQAVLASVWEVFKNDEVRARGVIRDMLRNDMDRGDHSFVKDLMSSMKSWDVDEGEMMQKIDTVPNPETREKLRESYRMIRELSGYGIE